MKFCGETEILEIDLVRGDKLELFVVCINLISLSILSNISCMTYLFSTFIVSLRFISDWTELYDSPSSSASWPLIGSPERAYLGAQVSRLYMTPICKGRCNSVEQACLFLKPISTD